MTQPMGRHIYRNLLILTAVGIAGGGLRAQQAPASAASSPTAASAAAPPDTPAAKAKATQLKTIVVTATKRVKSADEIAATINALEGSDLEQHNVQNLDDIAAQTPGVNIATPPGNASRITIRGVSSEANTNPTAGVLYEDTSLLPSYVPMYTPSPYPFDLDDVEVLKGPQGTLFGTAALNGAIRYVPTQPQFGELSGHYYTQYSTIPGGGQGAGSGIALNLPLDKANRLALRITAYDNQLPGYINNTRTHQSDSNRGRMRGARAILAWKPIDPLNISFTFGTQSGHWDDVSSTSSTDGLLSTSDRPRSSPYNQRYNLANLKVDYDLGSFSLISESSYVRTRFDGFFDSSYIANAGGILPLLANTNRNNANIWSQEFRAASNPDASSRWSWTGGVFATRQLIDLNVIGLLGDSSLSRAATVGAVNQAVPGLGSAWAYEGFPDYSISTANVAIKEVAAFFDVTRKLGDNWELSLGGRLYKTESGGEVDNAGLVTELLGYSSNGIVVNQTVHQDGFTPKISLLWHLDPHTNLYLQANKGYRVGGPQWGAPGLTGLVTTPTTFHTDTIWNYELGLHARWLDNKLAFNSSLFYENWKNPQVLLIDAGGEGSYIGNVGKVISKGAESSLQYLIPQIQGLSFKFSGAYTHAIVTQSLTTAFASTVAAGTPWPLSPKWQSAATLDYEHSFGDWYAGGYVSNSFLGRTLYGLNQPSQVYGYAQWSAQLRVGNLHWPSAPELSLSVTNLSDRRGVTNAYTGQLPIAWQTITYLQPRTLMLRLSGSF